MPNAWPAAKSAQASPTTISIPAACARVRTTSIVWGWHRASTKKRLLFDFVTRAASAIASAAAVGSSSIDAFAMARPVRSPIIVWKLISASRRPCEISGWYGV